MSQISQPESIENHVKEVTDLVLSVDTLENPSTKESPPRVYRVMDVSDPNFDLEYNDYIRKARLRRLGLLLICILLLLIITIPIALLI